MKTGKLLMTGAASGFNFSFCVSRAFSLFVLTFKIFTLQTANNILVCRLYLLKSKYFKIKGKTHNGETKRETKFTGATFQGN